MEQYSPELKEIIAVIRREHRRTQIVFGISIIILAVIITFIAPAVIRLDISGSGNQDGTTDMTAVPSSPGARSMPTAASTTKTTTTSTTTSTTTP